MGVRLSLVLALGVVVWTQPASAQRDCLSGCVPPYQVQVTVKGHSGTGTYSLNSGAQKAWFTVYNTGANGDTFTLEYGCLVVTCTGQTYSSPVFIAASSFLIDTVYFTVGGAGGTGTVSLSASGTNDEAASATFHPYVTPAPIIVLKPDSTGPGPRAVVHSRQPIVRALFNGNGGSADSSQTVLKWRDTVVARASYRANGGLLEWEVDSAHQLGIGDSAHLTVTACDAGAACTSVTRWVVLLNDHAPVLGFTGVPFEALDRVFVAPFGPGLSVSGGELSTSISTPSYFDMGRAWNFGLVYSTRQSYPRATVPVDVELPWPNGTASKLHVTLVDSAGVVLDSQVTTNPTCMTGSVHKCRVALQADFSGTSYATPTRKWLRINVQVDSATTTHSAVDSTEVVIVDRRSTPYGSGWWPAAELKLVPSGKDRLLIQPDGSAEVFRGTGDDSLFLSPPGDTRVLVRSGTFTWTLSPRHSVLSKLVFDDHGRLSSSVDNSGNTTSLYYGGAPGGDQLDTAADYLGKMTVLSYVPDGAANFLSKVTLPDSRALWVNVDTSTGKLTSDSLGSTLKAINRAFAYQSYPGTKTLLLTKASTTAGDTTVVTYDSTWRRKPTQVTLASVDTGGGTASAVLRYTAVESRGVGTPVSLDSAYVETKNPLGTYIHSLVNRWGEPTKVWDESPRVFRRLG